MLEPQGRAALSVDIGIVNLPKSVPDRARFASALKVCVFLALNCLVLGAGSTGLDSIMSAVAPTGSGSAAGSKVCSFSSSTLQVAILCQNIMR